MSKTVRYMMYVVIIVICIMSIFVGVTTLEVRNARINNETLSQNNVEPQEIEEKSTTEKFKELFTNEFTEPRLSNVNIQKLDNSKPIVYEESQTVKLEDRYSIDAHLPVININSELAQKYNNDTVQNFATKAMSLMSSQTDSLYTIYETSFTAFVNNNILSVAIMGLLKEGNNAERVIVRTYNYNLATEEEVTISDILANRELDSTAVNKKINSEIRKAAEEAETLSQTGYEVFKRNVEDTMYNVANVTNFIQGPSGELYIIYAYGNTNNTYEMDVIEV